MLHVNSKFRSIGTCASFIIDLDLPTVSTGCSSVTLTDVVLPNGWYNFSANYNRIIFNEGTGDLTATVPVGNYTGSTIESAIEAALNAASTLTQVYTCTYSELTGLITISAAAAFILKFSRSGSPAYRLGFSPNDTSSATSHTGTLMMNLAPDNFVYLAIDGLPECLTADTQGVICTFPISLYNNTGTISKFENKLTHKVDKSWFRGRNTRIRLFDMNGLDLPLLVDWGFTLEIKDICQCGK